MRVLLVAAHYPPDLISGATLAVERLATALARDGVAVDVLAGRIDGTLPDGAVTSERRDGVDVHWLGTAERIHQDDDANWRNEHAEAAMARLLATRRPDVVHAHLLQTLGADLLAPIAAAGIPIVVTLHDFWWSCARLFLVDPASAPCALDGPSSACPCARDATWRRQRAEHLGARLADAAVVLAPSATFAEAAVRHGGWPLTVAVDANDIADDLADDLAAGGGADAAARPRPADDDVRFLYVGGDAVVKGRDVVRAAAHRLRDRSGWRLMLRGVPAPGRRERWRHRRLTYAPAYPPSETARVLADTDVLIVPSLARESFSLVVREALWCGVPVLTSACLGPEEVVVDGVNGRILPLGDDGALAAAMAALVDDRTALAAMRQAARATSAPPRRAAEHAAALRARYEALVAATGLDGTAEDAPDEPPAPATT